jgi:peptidoglycan/LPS O-acetylase OafA/YrhL
MPPPSHGPVGRSARQHKAPQVLDGLVTTFCTYPEATPKLAATTHERPMQRLGYLDGLRGLAALYVLIFHMALVPASKPPVPQWLHPVVMFGGSGVLLFFVVSAFSLCLTMHRHETLWGYGGSRLFRIAPLFYALIAFTLVRDILVFGVWHVPAEVLLSATFALNLVPGSEQGFVWAGWTIGVEMLFYLAFPLLRGGSLNRRIVTLCAALVLGMVFKGLTPSLVTDPQVRENFEHFSIVQYLPVFLLGMLAYDAYRSERLAQIRSAYGGAIVATGLLGLAAIVAGRLPTVVMERDHLIGLCYALVLVGLSDYRSAAFDNPATRFLGRISYSVYLWHAPIIYAMGPVYAWLGAIPWPASVRFGLCLLATLGVVVPAAYISYRLVELPGIALGRRVAQRRRQITALVTTANPTSTAAALGPLHVARTDQLPAVASGTSA